VNEQPQLYQVYNDGMKLLLTSGGFTNKSIIKALKDLVGDGFANKKLAFIPTAANVEEGGKDWLIKDYANCAKLGFSEVDIVDISALSVDVWKPRLENVDVIVAGGGNTFHLMHWFKKSGLDKLLPELLKTKVYVGISAGSCVTCPSIYNAVQNLFGEKYNLKIKEGLGLVNFQFIPHLNSTYFPKIRIKYLEAAAKKLKEPIYAADDNTAVKVVKNKIEVVSEGEWKKFNKID